MSVASTPWLGSTPAGGWRGLTRPVAAAGAVAGASLLLRVRDPYRSGSYGLCPFEALTGWYCPACGGLRGANDLASGRVLEAASSNALLVAVLPLVTVLWVGWVRAAWRGQQPSGRWRAWLPTPLLLGVLAVFTLARNLGFGAWLAP